MAATATATDTDGTIPGYIHCDDAEGDESNIELKIVTLAGPMSIDELPHGVISIHEHIFYDYRSLFRPSALLSVNEAAILADGRVDMASLGTLRLEPWACKDNLVLDSFDIILRELKLFHTMGGRVLVEATHARHRPLDIDRYIELQERSGVIIILGTGAALQLPDDLNQLNTADLAKEMRLEVTHGLAEMHWRGSRAGLIGEISTSIGLSAVDIKVISAAALAQAETGAPMLLSVPGWRKHISDVMATLREAGASLEKIVLSGLSICPEDVMNLQLKVLAAGMSICIDDIGCDIFPAGEDGCVACAGDVCRLRSIVLLVKNGFASRVLLSSGVRNRTRLCQYGGLGFGYPSQAFATRLRTEGVSDSDVTKMLQGNASRLLCWWRPTIGAIKCRPILWSCDMCKNDFSPDHKQFTKFRFKYCSMPCLINHKKIAQTLTN